MSDKRLLAEAGSEPRRVVIAPRKSNVRLVLQVLDDAISARTPVETVIRDEQAKVLRTVRPMTVENMVRGQFRGYKGEPGVSKDSYMATYAALRMYVDSWRWHGVPFYVRAGKCLKTTCTEVIVELNVPPQVVFHGPSRRSETRSGFD